MRPRTLLTLACVVAAGCQTPLSPETGAYADRMQDTGDQYVACLSAEADKHLNPAAAEDIALAAHGRCWSAWNEYRDATTASFSLNASSPQEKQLARDKADAQLRQFEIEARQTLIDRIVERTMPGAKRNP